MDDESFHERIYLPSIDHVNIKDYLYKYTKGEFPFDDNERSSVYSIPKHFQTCGKRQAALAEEQVFNRYGGIDIPGVWLIFFHSASYAGHSFRNQRVGRLMIREHDFVVFAQYKGKYYISLIEVKSTNDSNTKMEELEKTSDAKVIKNNKRTAQHQLRDHMEVLQGVFAGEPLDNHVQNFIMWPFLGAFTKDPKQQVIPRWREDNNLHVFENTISSQRNFNKWFYDVVLSQDGTDEEHFVTLLNRFVILSCGVFINEINDNLIALLTQDQLQVLNSETCRRQGGGPLVVHGAAGTGKTLLILKKLELLYLTGQLNEENRALYICYWPGIRCEVELKCEKLGISKFVDTKRYFITTDDFELKDSQKYKHIFMDEAEAICLAFGKEVIQKTFSIIYKSYHNGNCENKICKNSEIDDSIDLLIPINKHKSKDWGELWFMVDINQAAMFLPKHSPALLKTPQITLRKVMRSTGYIFNVFKQFYNIPMPLLPKPILANLKIQDIEIGHHINGPPVYWVQITEAIDKTIADIIIDLCSTKGFKPSDMCIIPFLVNEKLVPEKINKHIDEHFVDGYRPRAIKDVEYYLRNKELNDVLIAWALRVKGLEFKVVIMPIEDDDFDCNDSEDRRKAYIIASRCTCMLIIISTREVRESITDKTVEYPFHMNFNVKTSTEEKSRL